MPPEAHAGDPQRPEPGDQCPRCGDGVLQLIAQNEHGYTLRCWNCDTSASIPREGAYVASVDPETHTPVGFQLTHAQHAARREFEAGRQVDVEQLIARDHAQSDRGESSPHPEWGDPHA